MKYTPATAATAAVSVLRREVPNVRGRNPAAIAVSTSTGEKSPSGPMSIVIDGVFFPNAYKTPSVASACSGQHAVPEAPGAHEDSGQHAVPEAPKAHEDSGQHTVPEAPGAHEGSGQLVPLGAQASSRAIATASAKVTFSCSPQ